MSFGVYRPTMGVAGGHRETCSNQSWQEQRRRAEQYSRQENPITGEPLGGASGSRRPPSGNLSKGLVPTKGPFDHMTVPDRDVPQKRVDPTRNRSASLGPGGACVPHDPAPSMRAQSRLTEGQLGEGLAAREPTPERRRTPGQVVKGGSRPKDNLTAGCLTSDKQDHPMALPRRAGSCGPGVGSGGSGHLVAGPMGFVPAGQEDMYGEAEFATSGGYSAGTAPRPFQRACGVAAVGAR
eukprot:TRINITY_DN39484_c0_g1_i1.p1 TRINITY_DN39484_c0_g1~~TRINITY_DN39484_c0_g1_i1.p1  ORF type:complete len:258 (+),score=21.60 TRINITY_DN39484_c0_g1_i1:62-775(+)